MVVTPAKATMKRLLTISLGWMIALAAVAMLSSCATDEQSADKSSATSVPSKSTVARKGVTHDFVVPAGTSEKLEKGEDLDLIPRRLDVHVGDKIRVRNDDSELVRLGLFDVAPGETVTMNFTKPGPMSGAILTESSGCGAPPPEDKVFVINVKP